MWETLIGFGVAAAVAAGIWHLVTGRTMDDSPLINALITLHMGLYIAAGIHSFYWLILQSYPQLEWWQAANMNAGVVMLLMVAVFCVLRLIEKREGK